MPHLYYAARRAVESFRPGAGDVSRRPAEITQSKVQASEQESGYRPIVLHTLEGLLRFDRFRRRVYLIRRHAVHEEGLEKPERHQNPERPDVADDTGGSQGQVFSENKGDRSQRPLLGPQPLEDDRS